MSIVSTGKTLSTTEYLMRKRKEHRKRLLVACGVLLVVMCVLVLVLRLKVFQITQVEAIGVPATGSAQVESVAQELLSGSYLWLVPKSNVLFYPRAHLEQELVRRFPRLTSVAISLEGTHLVRVEAAERKPFALYCNPLVLSGVEGCYFLDETGFIFDTSPIFSEGVYFTYSSEPALENPLGKQFLPEAEFESLSAFISKVRSFGVEPRSVKFEGSDSTLLLASGGTILFPREANMADLSQRLESFLTSKEIKSEMDFWQKLSALDMRTDNKVFYTFRE